MYCWNCGKEISATAESCPYCGSAQERKYEKKTADYEARPTGSWQPDYYLIAVISFAAACVSVVFPMGGLLTLLSIAASIFSLIEINKYGCQGRGFAIAGIAVGGARIILEGILYFRLMSLGVGFLGGFLSEVFPIF